MIKQLSKWHQTVLGLIFFMLVELGLSYGLISLAINDGSWFWYLVSLILFVGSLKNLIKLIGKLLKNGKRKTS